MAMRIARRTDMNRLCGDSLAARCLQLALATFLTWLVALVPAVKLFGADGFAALSFSALVCFVPGCLVFRLVADAPPAAAQIRVVAIGTVLRLLFALGGAFVMHQVLSMSPRNYLPWLGLFYFVALLAETYLIMPERRSAAGG